MAKENTKFVYYEDTVFEAYKKAVHDLTGEKLVCELNKEAI